MKLQKEKEYSSLEISEINMKDEYVEKRKIENKKIRYNYKGQRTLGKIGIKIDTEGYELDVILDFETLKFSQFVIAEVRHNHESLKGVYKLQEFINLMDKNNFTLSIIFTAKPFIADLCFQPKNA